MDASSDFPEAVLAALSQHFVGAQVLEETMHRVASISMQALPQFAHVGVTLMPNGGPRTFVFTDEIVLEVDEAQYTSGRGPCLDAYRTCAPVIVDSTLESRGWPEFCRAGAGRGVLSSLALPLIAQDGAVGALNLYARTEHAVTEDDVQTGLTFAGHAAYLLVNSEAYWGTRTLNAHLTRALETRSTIEQAKGIIMGSSRCTPDEAMRLLIRQSQHQNVKLHEIAAEIVAHSQRDRRP